MRKSAGAPTPETQPVGPFTRYTTSGGVARQTVGRLPWAIERHVGVLGGSDDPVAAQVVERFVSEDPRTVAVLSQGRIRMFTGDGIVDAWNGHSPGAAGRPARCV